MSMKTLGQALSALLRSTEREPTDESNDTRDERVPRALVSPDRGRRSRLRRRDLVAAGAAMLGPLLVATACVPRGGESVSTPGGRTPLPGSLTPSVTLPPSPSIAPTARPSSPTALASPTSAPTAKPPTPTATSASQSSPTAQPSASPSAGPATATPRQSGTAAEPAPVIVRGKAETKIVALTMDAGGKTAEATPTVLDILKEHKVRATIFMTGEWAETFPELLKRMVDDGHDLANHTFTHRDLTKLTDEEIVAEMARTEATVKQLVGVTTKPYMRAPFGAYDDRVLRVLGAEGYQLVHWTLDSGDWRPEVTADQMAQRVGERAAAGDIVVFHVYPTKTAQALPSIVDQLRERGLTPGSLRAVMA